MRWSPDGKLIAYMDGGLVKCVRPDGSDEEILSSDTYGFAWSPDSASIAFIRDGNLRNIGRSESDLRSLSRIVDGEVPSNKYLSVVYLTKNGAGKYLERALTASDFHDGAGPMSWSPDSRTIVFSRSKSDRFKDIIKSELSLIDVADQM